MLRCGLKFTHDGTVAVADGNRLVGSIEMEKVGNRPRWSEISGFSDIEGALESLGIAPTDIGQWIVDGWVADQPLQALESSQGKSHLQVAAYRETSPGMDLLAGSTGSGLLVGGANREYRSYRHVAGHIFGAYCTSPFASRNEPAFVLVWDGGMEPRLYSVDPRDRSVRSHGPLFHLFGSTYAYATRHFGPFKAIWSSGASDPENVVAGRLMAYIALGQYREPLIGELEKLHASLFGDRLPGENVAEDFLANSDGSGESDNANRLFEAYARSDLLAGLPDADILLAIHEFLGRMLVTRFRAHLQRLGITSPVNLCLSGGCALNIKWNRSLRECELVRECFVPPFPNDSGSAIGMLACDLFKSGSNALQWNPYLGPELGSDDPPVEQWAAEDCSMAQLATLIEKSGEAVVLLDGRSELGPRALGHRSIVASASTAAMRDHLNAIKGRESFRPVAPICMEEHARHIFDPGGRDPFMIFEHRVRPEWRDRIPAVVHVDGSARLQTVSRQDAPELHALLAAHHALTGVPVLCNTSANFSGSGFFPDAASAARWGGCRYIWAHGQLFTRR